MHARLNIFPGPFSQGRFVAPSQSLQQIWEEDRSIIRAPINVLDFRHAGTFRNQGTTKGELR